MITQKITTLPPAPDSVVDTPSEFSQKAVASVLAQRGLPGELNNFATQANALAVDFNVKATRADAAAQAATGAMQAAVAAAGAPAWVSGTTYQKNAAAISQINFRTYRRRVAGAGAIDPANDSANWRVMASESNLFEPVTVASNSIDLNLGPFFTKTITGNTTLSIDNCPPGGVSFTLELVVTAGSVTFAQAANIKTPYDNPLTLAVNRVHELMFVTTNGGSRWKLIAANNFAI